MPKLDHVIIAVNDLEQAMEDYRALGFTVNYGGRHASGTTHNALICFQDGTYLELLGLTGDPPQPGMTDFTPVFAQGERLLGYALRTDDAAAEARALRARGAQVTEASEGSRMTSDGIEIRWRGIALDGGLAPFWVEDVTPRSLRVSEDIHVVTHANGVTGIAKLEGADFDSLRGNQHLTAIIFSAPKLVAFDAGKTHGVRLTAI
jgi:hypothetical protein